MRATLADILADPEKAGDLALAEVCELIGDLERCKARLSARLIELCNRRPPVSDAGDRLLDVEQATQKLGTSRDWLYRHAKKLPFAVRNGRQLRFSERGIERYIKLRAGRGL